MREGEISGTAQRVAAYRMNFARRAAPYGDPSADDRLAVDVSAGAYFEPSERMARYLEDRTAFFDEVVCGALDGGVKQMVMVGAGYDGRALRYAKEGVQWFELDHPVTQADKRSRLERLGIETGDICFIPSEFETGTTAEGLRAAGFDSTNRSQLLCEGVAVYLERPVLEQLLGDLRSIVGPDSRLALSVSTARSTPDYGTKRERFESAVAMIGEPARNGLDAEQVGELLRGARWLPLDFGERQGRGGFIVAKAA